MLHSPPSIALARLDDPAECARIEAFVADRDGVPFQRPLWLRAIERGTGQRAFGLVTERAGHMTGWLPLTEVHSPIFGRALVSSGFAVRGGPLADSGDDELALCRAAEELAHRRSITTIELRGGNAPDGWHSTDETHCYFGGPLAENDEAQMLAIPRRARAEVRKGLENDLEISIGSDEADRSAHYACYARGVHNHGTPVFPRSLFDAVLDAFGAGADILTVRHRGEPVSSLLTIYHGDTAMPYWSGGTLEARKLRANERSYFELMRHSRDTKGCRHFDFGRSKTGSGPYFFKKNWGYEPQPLLYSKWTQHGAETRNINPTDEKYSSRIALWRRMPLPLANAIGPLISRGLG